MRPGSDLSKRPSLIKLDSLLQEVCIHCWLVQELPVSASFWRTRRQSAHSSIYTYTVGSVKTEALVSFMFINPTDLWSVIHRLTLSVQTHTTTTTSFIELVNPIFRGVYSSCPREGTANRQIIGISYAATQTRKSLVKGERFIRAVWMAEMMSETCDTSNDIARYDQVAGSVRFSLESDF